MSIACGDPTGSSGTSAIYDALGPYHVVSLGPPPVEGTVTVTDINASGVTVGYITISDPTSTQYPFRWANGSFQLLSRAGATRGIATGVNDAGDVVGRTSEPVIWPAGSTDALPIVPPDSTALRSLTPVDLTDGGLVLLRPTDGGFTSTGAVVRRSPFAVLSRMLYLNYAVINNAGYFGGRAGDGLDLYPTVIIRNVLTGKSCGLGGHSNINAAVALTDKGELLYSYGSIDVSEYRIANIESCKDVGTVSERGTVRLRSMNGERVIVGDVGGVASVGVFGIAGFADFDGLLRRSGGAAADWHVRDAYRVSSTGIFLVDAEKPGTPRSPVLLVPGKEP